MNATPEPLRLQKTLLGLAASGDAPALASLLAWGVDPGFDDSAPLSYAALNGHAQCVKILLPLSDPAALGSRALRWAAKNGRLECAKLLLPACFASAEFDGRSALDLAAMNGHVECVRLLIPLGHVQARNSAALRFAADNGHAECVKLLLPLSDPKANGSQALFWAARHGHAECARILIPLSDPATFSPALMRSVASGHFECSKLLLDALDASSRHEKALHEALKYGREDIVEFMLARDPKALAGLDLDQQIIGAVHNCHFELAAFLRAIAEKAVFAAASASEQALLHDASRGPRHAMTKRRL